MQRRYREFLVILLAMLVAATTAWAQPASFDTALADLSARVGTTVTLNQLDNYSWDQEQFSDASLDCPQPGVMYAQVITRGYIFTLSYGGTIYDYRANDAGDVVFLCSTSSAEPTAVPPPPTLVPRFPTGETITADTANLMHEIARATSESGTFNPGLSWLPTGDLIAVAAGGAPEDPTMTSGGVLLYNSANVNDEPERVELNATVTALASGELDRRPYVLAGTDSGDVVLFAAAPVEEPLAMQPGAGLDRVNAVALSHDMAYAAAAYGATDDPTVATTNVVQIWEAISGAPLRVLDHPAPVTTVAFSPDGAQIATGDAEGVIYLWDVLEGTLITSLHAHPMAIRAIAFSPDGTQIATGSDQRFTRVWNMTRGTRVVEFDNTTDDAILTLAFSPDGSLLATAGGNPEAFTRDNSIRLWDMTGQHVAGGLMGHDASVMRIAFSPDSTRIASVSQDGTLRIWAVTDDAVG
ncbi:MAG: WD40 repeat domain-containing protein [Anaerolineae bacterium]|nr:WD40 repeat domain-containing protein [Anaerolineae bacterium]